MQIAPPVLKPLLLAALLVGLASTLAGCSEPLGEDQLEFVGIWKSPATTMTITAKGEFVYESQSENTEQSVALPIRSISDSEIVVGAMLVEQTFSIEGPPSIRDGVIALVVDGEVLRKMNATGTGAVIAGIPTNDEIEAVVRKDLTSLMQAITNDDYVEYWEGLSKIVQTQTTPEDLRKNFKEAVDREMDLGFWLSGAYIQRIGTEITPQGTILVQGAFVQAGGQYLGVDNHYLNVHGSWRGLLPKLWVAGYEVRKPVPAGAADNTDESAAEATAAEAN